MIELRETFLDAPAPLDMTRRAEQAGIKKADLPVARGFVLALLAGAFIAFGAIFSTTAVAAVGTFLPFGLVRLVAGVSFSFCLVLVVVSGAELFTGNTLMVVAWANRKLALRSLLRNWTWVYGGNFVGSVAMAALVYASGQYTFGKGAIGQAALTIAKGKLELGWGQAVALGVLANVLVCMAIWLSFSARTTTDRILSIMPPIAAFVCAGFEHSIANMYFIPAALFIKAGAPPSFWTAIGKSAADFSGLTWQAFLWRNLLPVTIGNILGGSLVVGLSYWFAYLRAPRRMA